MSLTRSALAGLILFLTGTYASAAIVTLYGDDVSFTYDDSTLYGSAFVVGNSIYFQPTVFRAESLNGTGSDSINEMLDVRVEITTDGYWMEEFALVEAGDYYLSGAGASVSASGTFGVTSNTSAYSVNNAFTAGPLTVQGVTTDWLASSEVDLSDTAGWYGDTDVTVMVDNDLVASTASLGEQAWVQKKIGGVVGLTITAVPVPAAVWLFGSALAGLGWLRRKPS